MAQPTSGDSGPRGADLGGSMFREASDIHIHGGTFNAYGSRGTDKTETVAKIMALLGSRAEKGAPYDAAAREDVPKCQEHTRVAITEGIHKWANSQEPGGHPLMWMYGPAGSGKTTIMQTVAETFDKEGSLATSFFFSRLSPKRPREKENFVITMAHQLSLCIPALQQPLADTLSDPSIITKSLTKQLDSLIINPLKTLDPAEVGSRCILMVDGLDECNGDTAQRDVLDLLERLLDQTPHRVRILVASRALSHIQSFFARASIRERTQTTPLDNDYQSNQDIHQYFISKFGGIRGEHPARSGLPSEWPSRSDIYALVNRASGQFIYASVVMKFIANHGRHPDESLQTIIRSKASDDARPYDELDALYAQVLSSIEPENLEFVQTLMGCLLISKHAFLFADVVQTEATKIDSLFMIPPGMTAARISRIFPLITANDDGMKFAHASFPEYLLDQSRSKEFFLDIRKVHCSLARLWFESYSRHFRHHPLEGAIMRGVAGYGYQRAQIKWWPDSKPSKPELKDRTLLLDMIRHCMRAEWTSELQQDILAFDLQAAFRSIDAETYIQFRDPPKAESHWPRAVIWLSFTIWIEKNHLLSPADIEYLQGCIQSQLMALQISPADGRTIAAVLTWHNHIDIEKLLDQLKTDANSLSRHHQLVAIFRKFPEVFDVDIQEASRIWLCQTLVPDMTMKGSFFTNENIYADLILRYIRNSRDFYPDSLKMLCKAAPSTELAACLIQRVWQLRRNSTRISDDIEDEAAAERELFMPICIYLFECGIPIISEHRHRLEFHALKWICGVCVLFDPLKECADIELSRDPPVNMNVIPAHIVEEQVPQPLQINQARQFIAGIPPLWLRAWIFWLADLVTCFIPVVA
ncbi:hypothetical protein D9619_011968 [Psilocybe cf. subviscida]|uniref:NACHT domain-containing protein n=1 Tax=Psilocybe cf. subviscida TaxID=2480587 RepID=A0A8H5B272_9AGAR|nr:hypothetical protein D9619_011968 [Psilocybe cf. subviscida]